METAVAAVAYAAFVYKLVDFLKYLAARNLNAVLTQLITWAAGIAAAFLWAASDWAESIDFLGMPLADLNGWSLVLVGFGAASTASAGYDAKKAIDNTDGAQTPPLFRPRP